MYEYLSKQSEPVNMTYGELLEWFGLDKKQYTPSSFKVRILNKVKNELDKKCPITFRYEVIKKAWGKGEEGVRIFPKKNLKYDSNNM